MRITNNMMTNKLMSNLTRNMNRMSRYQDQLATGKQVIRASDDPVAASTILKFKSDIAALGQYEKNTGDSLAWLEVTESAISDVGDVVQRMRELAVRAANGTNTAEDTQKIAKEIEQLKKHLITDGNFSYAGRYAFSGYQTDKPLFNEDGTYAIDITQNDITEKAQLQYQVSIAQDMEVTTNGLDVFGVQDPGAPYYLETLLPTDPVDHAAGSTDGVAATKSVMTMTSPLTQNLSLNNLNVVVTVIAPPSTTTYTVDTSGLTGGFTEEELLQRYTDSGITAVADVFLDSSKNLVIKAKEFGSNTSISGVAPASYNPPVNGTDVTEATLTGPVLPAGPWVMTAQQLDEMLKTPVFITVEGQRKRIDISDAAVITDPVSFQTALQAAVNDTTTGFGPGKVSVALVGGAIQFQTVATADGITPSIKAEHVVAKGSAMMTDIDNFITALNTGDQTGLNTFLGKADAHLNQVLAVRADIGARVNRMELIANRISDNTISFTKMLSDAQDADMGGVIMFLKNAENVYKAALSTGSKVIQPSLIDFLR